MHFYVGLLVLCLSDDSIIYDVISIENCNQNLLVCRTRILQLVNMHIRKQAKSKEEKKNKGIVRNSISKNY